jgi:hypothetical protein
MDKCTLPTHTGKTINGKPPAHSPVGDPPPPMPHSLYPGPHVSAPRRYHATPTRSATKLTRKTENIKLYLGLIKKHSAPLFSISHFSLYPSLSRGGGRGAGGGGGGPRRRIAAHLHISAHIHDIGTSPRSNLGDLRASPPLPPCL